MSRVCWLLHNARPSIKVNLTLPSSNFSVTRILLADTGAGSSHAGFELVLSESDCRKFFVRQAGRVSLGGAYAGVFLIYIVRIEVPALSFGRYIPAVAVPTAQLPSGFDGIAAFRFLNRFAYGNFSDPNQFCLETL